MCQIGSSSPIFRGEKKNEKNWFENHPTGPSDHVNHIEQTASPVAVELFGVSLSQAVLHTAHPGHSPNIAPSRGLLPKLSFGGWTHPLFWGTKTSSTCIPSRSLTASLPQKIGRNAPKGTSFYLMIEDNKHIYHGRESYKMI